MKIYSICVSDDNKEIHEFYGQEYSIEITTKRGQE